MQSRINFSDNRVLGFEPHLSEVLSDPVIHAVMARDGVTKEELCSVILSAQKSLRARLQR